MVWGERSCFLRLLGSCFKDTASQESIISSRVPNGEWILIPILLLQSSKKVLRALPHSTLCVRISQRVE